MNVLIITPDRVGSTLLQRLITIFMNFHEFDRPVINLHELTNGLMRYYSPTFNREVLGKPNDRPWGYFQTLPEITELLHSIDHYKTSRLAHYHILRRGDSLADQVPFYQYLNDNFFVISARRQNLLEHGLSWCISTHSKKLNVYNHQEKIDTFANIYQNRITVDTRSLTKYLNDYKRYLQWVDDHFSVASYFEYERDLPNIEQYIMSLDIFGSQPKKNWASTFSIEFSDWNRCHYLASDLSGIGAQLPAPRNMPRIEFDSSDQLDSVELAPVTSKNAIASSLSDGDQQFLSQHVLRYVSAYRAIDQLVKNKVLVTGVPIKLQTMMEKKLLIKNFDQCVDVYNQWTKVNDLGRPYTDQDIVQQAKLELKQWHVMPLLK